MQTTQIINISVMHNDTDRPTVFIRHLGLFQDWMHCKTKAFSEYQSALTLNPEILKATATTPDDENLKVLAEEIALTNHYALLNAYDNIVGMKWPVTEAIWWRFYEMLPPAYYGLKSEGFRVCEPCCAAPNNKQVYSAYYKENGIYWHEWVVA